MSHSCPSTFTRGPPGLAGHSGTGFLGGHNFFPWDLVITRLWCPPRVEFLFPPGQIRSVTQSCPTLWDPMNRSTPGLPVHHQLPEFTQTHVHRVSDAIQPSHPLSSPSPPALNPSQHQGLFQWVSSSHEVTKVLEFLRFSHFVLCRQLLADLFVKKISLWW